MTLRDDYIAFRQERIDKPFDDDGDQAFVREHFGMNVGSFCRKVFTELLEIQKRLEHLESDAHCDE